MDPRHWALLAALLAAAVSAGFIPAKVAGSNKGPEQADRPVEILTDQNDARLTLRAVTDVAPAVKNATVLALAEAQDILRQYSDTLRIASIPGGIVITFLGTFLLTPVLFTAGFLSGGGAAFVGTKALLGAETPSAAWASIIAMLIAGVLAGLLAMRLLSLGCFAVGALLGVAVASALTPGVLGRLYPPNSAVGFYMGAIILGCALGALAMRFQRQMVIIATAYGGAFAFFFGIGYFAGHFPGRADLTRAQQGLLTTWLVIYSLFTMLIGTTGAFTQFRLAGARPLVYAGGVDDGTSGGGWGRRRPETSPSEVEGLTENEQGGTAQYKIAPELEEMSNNSEGSTGKITRFAFSVSDSEAKMGTGKDGFVKEETVLSKSLSPQMLDGNSSPPTVELQKP